MNILKAIPSFVLFLSAMVVKAQKNYLFTTATSNITGNYAVIDLAALNGMPNAVFSVRTNAETVTANPHPIGVWYTGKNWSIFNQDRANMPSGVKFLVTISEKAVLQKASEENTRGAEMMIDAAPLNGNADAKFSITQNWNPGGGTNGVYNNSDVDAYYSNEAGKWILKNKSGDHIKPGMSFNIVEIFDDAPEAITSNSSAPQGQLKPNKSPDLLLPKGENTVANDGSDPAIYQFLTSNAPKIPRVGVERISVGNPVPIGDGLQSQSKTVINNTIENIVFNPQADAMYAGALIQSEPYFRNNTLALINKPVKAGTITLVGGNGPGRESNSRTLTEISNATYQDGVRSILQGLDLKNTSGNLVFDFKSCRTVSHGFVEAGINFRYTNFSADAGLRSNTDYEKSVVIGVLKQKYYSVTYQLPSDKRNFFKQGVTLAELQREGLVSANNRPCFISQVDYGRIFVLVAESEASADSLKMFLNANYNGAAVQVRGNLNYESFSSRNSVSIKIFSVGSNSNEGDLDEITPAAFKAFLSRGATGSVQNPGAPIAFRVKDLLTDAEIPTMLTADYTDIMGEATPEVYTYTVKPGNCADCVNSGVRDIADDGRTLVLHRGDVITIQATGRATHGPWLWSDAKGPEGQPGERTDPADPLPCNPGSTCECNRYAIIANIPNQGKSYTCVSNGFNAKVVPETMSFQLGFKFNDYNTTDGEGSFKVRVSRISHKAIMASAIKN